jgi:RecA-family ATPase
MTDNRVIAARGHLGLPPTVPLMIVQCPIDLRTNRVDAERMVNTIKRAIAEITGPLPVQLVIIDTMSRALNGGNEGAEDMAALLANADYIRHETGVAILFVAHCGKDAAKGIRGWSGVRAAIDVEIEVTARTDSVQGFVAEVTKERDLPSGDRFGFVLDPAVLGKNRRGKDVTTCVSCPSTHRPGRKRARRSCPR